ncbi:50S ribosomal protein L21 [Candidatus Sumerlaeota bacterium]|nr:50S ribosomal protein L21 [Candidatus Sumerlaeota bacterium]
MYAIIRTGGKQYKVAEGDNVKVELLSGETGDAVTLDDVLSLHDGEQLHIGRPTVAGAKVEAEIVQHGKGPKIRIHKFTRRNGFAKTQGHRQQFTELRINKISK